MKTRAALIILCAFLCMSGRHMAAAVETPGTVLSVRLYALDCGRIDFKDMAMFSDTGEYDGKSASLVDPCFLIRHPKGNLLWDTGLGDALIGRNDPANEAGVSLRVRVRLLDQLASIGIAPSNVTYVAFSHFHLDHTGNANSFPAATWIVNQAELDWALGAVTPPVVDLKSLSAYKTVATQMISGDNDVFHDGTVRILKAPGHTPGHQVLFLKLAKSGPVLLSGDLYHLRSDRPRAGETAARVMQINTSRADSIASVERIETILKNTHARLIIQHDPDDFRLLPASPGYLD
jgi:glyoxylase-like metal-dependent hydrolase (beta-lactamase superfamily II)